MEEAEVFELCGAGKNNCDFANIQVALSTLQQWREFSRSQSEKGSMWMLLSDCYGNQGLAFTGSHCGRGAAGIAGYGNKLQK